VRHQRFATGAPGARADGAQFRDVASQVLNAKPPLEGGGMQLAPHKRAAETCGIDSAALIRGFLQAPPLASGSAGDLSTMQTVSQVLRRERTRPRHRVRHRHKAIFVRDPLAHSTPLDRNARQRLIFLAKRLERRTKGKGRANGALGGISLTLLEALFSYANRRTGLCFPSYLTLQALTGLSHGSIAAALRRLERAGIIKITRRLKRIWINRMSPITGQPERIMATVQDSNLYAFSGPAGFAGRLDGYVEAYASPPARKIDVLARLVRRIEAESTDRGGRSESV
jgi:DNA-binding transcriptional ArsR family regulator